MYYLELVSLSIPLVLCSKFHDTNKHLDILVKKKNKRKRNKATYTLISRVRLCWPHSWCLVPHVWDLIFHRNLISANFLWPGIKVIPPEVTLHLLLVLGDATSSQPFEMKVLGTQGLTGTKPWGLTLGGKLLTYVTIFPLSLSVRSWPQSSHPCPWWRWGSTCPPAHGDCGPWSSSFGRWGGLRHHIPALGGPGFHHHHLFSEAREVTTPDFKPTQAGKVPGQRQPQVAPLSLCLRILYLPAIYWCLISLSLLFI